MSSIDRNSLPSSMGRFKYAFIVTVNNSYLFSLNAIMNAQEVAGTQANFEIIHGEVEPKYIEESKKAFDFDVIWTPRNEYHEKYSSKVKYVNYFSYKYYRALEVADKYDAVCIIDADLFMYTNVNKYFEMAAKENKIITARNVRSGETNESGKLLDKWTLGNPDTLTWGKNVWYLADFPIFFNPKQRKKLIEDWIDFHSSPVPEGYRLESVQPDGSWNRSLCKNLKSRDEVIPLDGELWVADRNYTKNYVEKKDNKLFFINGPNIGQQINAIHNRWWQPGRCCAETKRMPRNSEYFINTLKSMNTIKNFMDEFNQRKLSQYVPVGIKGQLTGEESDYK